MFRHYDHPHQVNAKDMRGEATPLYYAALAACEPAVDLLLLYGGDAQNSNTGEKVMMLNADKNGHHCEECMLYKQ